MDPHLLYLFFALLGVGALAGFSAGLFGIGGGTIIVPALYYMFNGIGYSPDITMHVAVATSAATIILTSFRSMAGHHRHGAVDWAIIWPGHPLKSWGIWIGAGALLASLVLVRWISGQGLTLIFGVLALLISGQLIFGRPGWRLADGIPRGAVWRGLGVCVGVLSALMGVGGGAMSATLLLVFGKPIHKAIGTGSAIGIFIAIPATIGFMISGAGVSGRPPFSVGYVNLPGFALICCMAILFIPLGVKVAHSTNPKVLKRVFGLFFALVALNMIGKGLLA